MSMDVIPYTVEVRKDTGLYNAKFGIWLFLSSEVMLFGALFSSYLLMRLGATNWPRGAEILNVPLGTLNTLILISSSVTVFFAWLGLKERNYSKYRLYMGLTILLAIVFLCVKAYEYSVKFSHGLYPRENTFFAIYFTLTGLHALHILGGVIVNFYLWAFGGKMWKNDPQRMTNRVEVAGIYWHFVDLVWTFLFPILYLL